ncbi:alpha/beta-hydrolase [Hesseltinella vesiculosa]|uniref:Alpha/beta-hydrolase n=1 Tax=Hesseltinella vesiculosa TaxID=101127 RepID=A0A1X2GDN9_9FUNG|nr:alpha/beta-hydrolase [Hesseltinella vesiculosa]
MLLTILLFLIYFAVAVTLLFTILLYIFQCELLYPAGFPHGSRSVVARPSQYDLPDKEVILETKDGVKIRMYVMIQRGEEVAIQSPTMIWFHSHTGNMGHRLPIAQVFYKKFGYNIVLVSYRGYGLSEGRPNEKGLKLDAQATLDYVLHHPILRHTKLVAFGQSLGGAVAIDLVAKQEEVFSALIIENTFLSMTLLIPHALPALRYLVYLCTQKWQSYQLISKLHHIPVLFLSSKKDELVPASHMAKLYNLCNTSQGKAWKEFENGAHYDTCMQPGYFDTIAAFGNEHIWDVE